MSETHNAATRLRQLLRFRLQRFGWQFGVYLTHWFYFSNHTYAGEPRYFVRVGEWHRNFGPVRRG